MDRIQVIFLFASYRQLKKVQQAQVLEVVRSAAREILYFGRENQVQITLEDGRSRTETNDLVLAIEKQDNPQNEAGRRTNFADEVAAKLKKIDGMKALGYRGLVTWQNGLVSAPKPSSARSGQPDEEAAEKPAAPENAAEDPLDYHTRAKKYQAEDALYPFEMLQVTDATLSKINVGLDRIKFEQKVFSEWGLYAIQRSPATALVFFGPSGTGKSLAAEAVANKLGKKIIRASYADIENKYVGEGPKNVSALFLAAEEQDAVLFIDEAESLLSKRLVNVQEASGQAINSMRSQILICLERFHGIAIFATNLVVNFDKAVISRCIPVLFELPDAKTREKIWEMHLKPRKSGEYELNVPLAADVDLQQLAEKYDLCGREIRNSVVNACVNACRDGKTQVDMDSLCEAAEQILGSRQDVQNAEDYTAQVKKVEPVELTKEEKNLLTTVVQKQYDQKKAAEQGESHGA